MEAPQTKFDAERKAAFLLAYERCIEVSAAAAAVGVTRQTVYNHLRKDPEFAEAFERADGRIDEKLMAQVWKVAVKGVVKKTYDKDGNLASVTRVFDNRVLLKLLARRRPSEWGDRVAIDQKVTGHVEHEHRVTPAQLPKEARDRMRDLLDTLPAELN